MRKGVAGFDAGVAGFVVILKRDGVDAGGSAGRETAGSADRSRTERPGSIGAGAGTTAVDVDVESFFESFMSFLSLSS